MSKKEQIKTPITDTDMLNFANYLRNGLTNLEYCKKTHREHLKHWRKLINKNTKT